MNSLSCDMIPQTDEDACLDGEPGSFFFDKDDNGQKRMWFVLPDGTMGVINLRPVVYASAHPSWEWDGNEVQPTLMPSVHLPGRWHGFFTAGRMVSCN